MRRLRFHDYDCDDDERDVPEQYLDCREVSYLLSGARKDIGPWTLPGLKSKVLATLHLFEAGKSQTPFLHLNAEPTAAAAVAWVRATVYAGCSADITIVANQYMPCGVCMVTYASECRWKLKNPVVPSDLPYGVLAVMRAVLDELGCCPEGALDSMLED